MERIKNGYMLEKIFRKEIYKNNIETSKKNIPVLTGKLDFKVVKDKFE
jgi:hypothetical protein